MNFLTNRRNFIKAAGIALAAPIHLNAKNDRTIQQVIDKIINEMTGEPLEQTVDVIKQGDASQNVTGITLTFLATYEVLQKAVDAGHNFIISHEPVFYEHLDKTDWLEDHPVYQTKRDFIKKHNLVIWRCHDYIHRMQPDGIIAGMTETFGWKSFVDKNNPALFHLPETTVADVVHHIKNTFELSAVKVVGDPEMVCSKVGLMVGAPGGVAQMNFTRDANPDVLICGEISEWMTNIYYRDAVAMQQNKALIVMGHQPSEEAGMRWMTTWLKEIFPSIEMKHEASGLGYTYL
jgi:putative NIF3 family GTP cyclohydrolase 1 type 2